MLPATILSAHLAHKPLSPLPRHLVLMRAKEVFLFTSTPHLVNETSFPQPPIATLRILVISAQVLLFPVSLLLSNLVLTLLEVETLLLEGIDLLAFGGFLLFGRGE